MSKIDEIEALLTDAMRTRDTKRVATLRLVLSSLRRVEKDQQCALSEEEELQILQRERKQRVEAAEAFAAAGRQDQAEAEAEELLIIEELMPPRLTGEELSELVDRAIADTGATDLGVLGGVMSRVMPEVAGRADGASVSQLAREKLA